MSKEIFGIELEVPLKVGVNISEFTRQLAASIGDDKVYQSSVRVGYHSTEYNNAVDLWRVASDGSLHQWGNRGIEVVSRRRTSLEEVAIAMAGTEHLIDKALLARSTCGGHHVHIGLLHFSAIKRSYNPETTNGIRKLVRTKRVKKIDIKIHEVYAYFQPVINALVSQSRRTGNRAYNRGVSATYLDAKNNPTCHNADMKNEYLNDKNRAAPWHGNRGVVNFGRLGSYGTVEYSQHQGTYSVATVTNWVKLMHRITSRCWVQETKDIDPADYPITVDGFADFLGLGANRVRAWMRRRANHFGYNVIASRNGVNPSVGVRVRNNEPLPDREVTTSGPYREVNFPVNSGFGEAFAIRDNGVPVRIVTLDDGLQANLSGLLLVTDNNEFIYNRLRGIAGRYLTEELEPEEMRTEVFNFLSDREETNTLMAYNRMIALTSDICAYYTESMHQDYEA